MATDSNGLSDELAVEVTSEQSFSPSKGAPTKVWVDYLVDAHGMDRGFLTGKTRHFNAEAGDYVGNPPLTRDQLIELADRLGG